MHCQKFVGAVDQHAAKLKGLGGKAQRPVTLLHHVRPHVVERVGEERQGAHVLDRVLRGASGDDIDEAFVLEPGGEQLGRPAHNLPQFRLTH